MDDTQFELLEIEEKESLRFYTAYLNNVRALVLLFNNVPYKEHFIMLPGDEVVEKKHKNIRHLMAMERNEDLSRRETRTFPGLGVCSFKIDFAKLSPEAYSQPDSGATQTQQEEKKVPENEINTPVEIKNTQHHKMIIKARNESYQTFRERFNVSVLRILQKFDADRTEEHRFNAYWKENLKEITAKHI